MAKSDVSVSTSTGRGIDEMEERMGTSSDSAIAVKHSEYVTAFEGGMLSNNCSTSAEDLRRTHVVWLEQERRECRSEEELATAISKPTWTQVAPLPSCSATGLSTSLAEGSSLCLLPAKKRKIQVMNEQFFQELIKRQPPPFPKDCWRLGLTLFGEILYTSAFFVDFKGRLKVGKKIAQGGQAEIYEALFDGDKASCGAFVECGFVLKVFRLELSEWFQHVWAKQVESNYMKYNELREDATCGFVCNCTLLKDGRYAFLMTRYWGDLRNAINVQILKDKTHVRPPFPPSISTTIMYQIARGMRTLHYKGILHRDLKADNVFVTNEIEIRLTESEKFGLFLCHVADFESTKGVMGTRFWRAPEVLGILKSSSRDKHSDPTIWTKKVDVYAYGMTCYEVLSGCIPFQSRGASDYDIGDERPPLPDYVDQEIQKLVRKCWDSEPLKRPTFEIICDELKRFGSRKIKNCEALAEEERDDANRWLYWNHLYIDKNRA